MYTAAQDRRLRGLQILFPTWNSIHLAPIFLLTASPSSGLQQPCSGSLAIASQLTFLHLPSPTSKSTFHLLQKSYLSKPICWFPFPVLGHPVSLSMTCHIPFKTVSSWSSGRLIYSFGPSRTWAQCLKQKCTSFSVCQLLKWILDSDFLVLYREGEMVF